MRKILFALLLALLPVKAFADAPPEIAPFIKATKPYGEARLNKLVFHVYDAALWTDAASWTIGKSFALTLRYGMNFDGDDLASRSVEEMNGQKKLDQPTSASWRTRLATLFPDVKKGDRITAIYLPGKEARIYHNGKYRGSVTGALFARRFIDIWMSPLTSEPAVRRDLIAKK